MQANSISKSAILVVVIVIISVASWEVYLRSTGLKISYDNLEPLWADKRERVYDPIDKAVVFIGSSRIKYDLDVPTWEQLTGMRAVQLACEGTNPVPMLLDLAADKNFKGNLVVDVTEGLFFSPIGNGVTTISGDVFKYYREITPAQKASFAINHLLESQFVFLDKGDLSLPALLDKLDIPSRKGVMKMPIFPIEFTRVQFSRQSYMTERLLKDTNIAKRVTDIWTLYGNMARTRPPVSDDSLTRRMNDVRIAVDKIKARGGKVFFVRTPSSGPAWMGEQMAFPRQKMWDRLIKTADCPAAHFADYPAIDHFICPEWSHLSPADAVAFTKEFVKILMDKKFITPGK